MMTLMNKYTDIPGVIILDDPSPKRTRIPRCEIVAAKDYRALLKLYVEYYPERPIEFGEAWASRILTARANDE